MPTSTDNADIFNGGTVTVSQTGKLVVTFRLAARRGADAIQMTGGSFDRTIVSSATPVRGTSRSPAAQRTRSTSSVSARRQQQRDLQPQWRLIVPKSRVRKSAFPAREPSHSPEAPHNDSGILISDLPGSSGTYNLNGGSLLSGEFTSGLYGTGNFMQSGGHICRLLSSTLVTWSGAAASYSLSGTAVVLIRYEYVGEAARELHAVRRHQHGPCSLMSAITPVAAAPTSHRRLVVTEQLKGSVNGGTGTFTQSGGTNAVGSILHLGYRQWHQRDI